VFIDGRADTIYGATTYLDYVEVLATRPGWLDRIERTAADYFLWPSRGYGGSGKAQGLLKTGRWEVLYQDSVSVLLGRTSVINSRDFRLGPATPYRNLGVAQVSSLQGLHDQAIELASKTRLEIPYQRGACNLLINAYRVVGDAGAAAQISRECRGYFPSYHLLR
jgi:hypothetical protein